MRIILAGIAAIIVVAAIPRSGAAQTTQHGAHALGTVDFRVSCSAQAQSEFNRGVALLHHMTYPGARQTFETVAQLDPQCAMAHWGIAMTLFQPLWPTRPTPAELRRGWSAVQTARSLGLRTERERLFVDATAEFFRDPDSTDYWQRIRRWEKAMERTYATLPHDTEVATFYALAHLAAAPVDSVLAHSERAANVLLPVYGRNREHPGAMHYLVHANDAPGRENESLDVTRRYDAAAPRNTHALHMPTHIYTRLGDWDAVIRGNLAAAEAALEHPVGDSAQFVWDQFPHAVEYLVYAYLQRGADDSARVQLERLHSTQRLQPTFITAFHLASTKARYALERREWSEALALTPRDPPGLNWDRFTWPEAVTWFARGLGAARTGNLAEARAAADRVDALAATAASAGESLFARHTRVLGLGVRAWLAHAEGDTAASVALMREAAELEVATPKHAVTPAPTIPAYELLGDLLMEQSRPADALAAYTRSLDLYPKRFNSLLGAARASRAAGSVALARAFYLELTRLALGAARPDAIAEANAFAARAQSASPQTGGSVLPPPDSYAGRALQRWATRIAADTSLQPALRQAAAAGPASAFSPRVFRSLDDATLFTLAVLINTTFRRSPPGECTAFLGGGAQPSLAFLATSDSVVVDMWLDVMQRILRAQGAGGPQFPVASRSDVNALMREMQARMSPAEERAAADLARRGRGPAAECEKALMVFGFLVRQPPARVGPFMRAMFAAGR